MKHYWPQATSFNDIKKTDFTIFRGRIDVLSGGFPCQPPICSGNDGLPTELLRQRIREDCLGNLAEKEIDKIIQKAVIEWRKESLKGYGNAVVPQLVLQIFKVIDKLET